MKELPFKIETLNLTEKFFIEKAIELLYRGSIDSYRVRVMNPYTILKELLAVAYGLHNGKVKNFITLESVINETIELIKVDKKHGILKYTLFDSEYYLEMLYKVNKATFEEYFDQLKNCTKILINDNKEYLNELIQEINISLKPDSEVISQKEDNKSQSIEEETQKVKVDSSNSQKLISCIQTKIEGISGGKKEKSDILEKQQPKRKKQKVTVHSEKVDIYKDVYSKIDMLTSCLLSGLISLGYSKGFLFKFFYQLFVHKENTSFKDAFDELKKLPNTAIKNYQVWFKVNGNKTAISNLNLFGNCSVIDDITSEIVLEGNNEFDRFCKKQRATRFISVNTNGQDHYSAFQKAKYLIAENIDVLSLGLDSSQLKLIKHVLVADKANLVSAEFHNLDYFLDGHFKLGQQVFEDMLTKVPSILEKDSVSADSKEKLKSAIRYLRLGNEALEIEHKFINYWVGLEYLFSNYKDSTFTRMKELLVCIQMNIYAKRNLREYHRNVKKVKLEGVLQHFQSNDLNCLLQKETYEELRDKSFQKSPLLSFRSWSYKQKFFTNDKRKMYFQTHKRNLENHLVRLYRVRNEIIHEAKYNFNNEGLTSHLKYYLVTTLSILIGYFAEHTNDEKVSIEGFYSLQKLKLDYQNKMGYLLNDILNSDEDFELLS